MKHLLLGRYEGLFLTVSEYQTLEQSVLKNRQRRFRLKGGTSFTDITKKNLSFSHVVIFNTDQMPLNTSIKYNCFNSEEFAYPYKKGPVFIISHL